MFSRGATRSAEDKASTLTLEDLVAMQPRHIRGLTGRGSRGPDGERPGQGRAQTLDFDGLSPYLPGDDIRQIDWRASLRSGQTTVRRFAAGSHRARVLVLDLRPDLYFGTSGRIMAKTACLTAAWLIWSSQILHEPVGLVCGSGSIPVRRGRRHVLRVLAEIAAEFADAADRVAIVPNLERAAAMVGRRDEVCLIADLPLDTAPLIAAARALALTRILRLFTITDPITLRPPAPGRYPVRGSDGARQVIHVRTPRQDTDRRRLDLMDAGWSVENAHDLLPRQAKS